MITQFLILFFFLDNIKDSNDFTIFAVLNVKIMNSKKLLPVWYGGGIGNNRNAFYGVGHLSYTGFIFPKRKNYEYQHPFERNRNEADEFLQHHH